jgi:hypothetical protein
MKTINLIRSSRHQKLTYTISLSIVILTSLALSTSLVAAQNPDFSISANPTTLCVNPGIDGSSAITITSLAGFSGTVNLGASISPSIANGPTLSSIPSSVDLTNGQTVPLNLDASTTQSTPTYVYTITVAGLSGQTYRSASFSLVVSADCSVGGVTSPASGLASSASSIALGITIAGLAGIAVAGLVFYLRRSRSNTAPIAHMPNPL